MEQKVAKCAFSLTFVYNKQKKKQIREMIWRGNFFWRAFFKQASFERYQKQ